MSTNSCILALAMLVSLPSFAEEHGPAAIKSSSAIVIDVQAVDPSAIIWLIARRFGVDMVAGPLSSELPIDVKGSFVSAQSLIEHVVKRRGGQTVQQGALLVVPSSCTTDVPASFASSRTKLVSVYAQRVLPHFLQLKDAHDARAQLPWLSIAVTDVPEGDLVQAIISSLGTGFKSGRIACDEQPPGAMPRKALTSRRDNCPYRKSSHRTLARPDCEPFEYYALHSLRPLGFVRSHERIGAVVAAPDGRLEILYRRGYVGQYHGVVQSVESDGFTVREIYRDREGVPQQVERKIRYGTQLSVLYTWPLDYVEENSPQRGYDDAVAELITVELDVETEVAVCARNFPHLRDEMEKAYADWKSRNQMLLNEVSRHGDIYYERMGAAMGSSALAISDKYMVDAVMRIEAKAGDKRLALPYCLARSVGLKNDLPNLQVELSRNISIVRACEKLETCPGLGRRFIEH